MGKPPCRTELGPPASCDQGAWRLPASPFYTSSTESKLHSGTLLGLRERPGGAETQRLSKLAGLCLASDGLHLESPALLKFASSTGRHCSKYACRSAGSKKREQKKARKRSLLLRI